MGVYRGDETYLRIGPGLAARACHPPADGQARLSGRPDPRARLPARRALLRGGVTRIQHAGRHLRDRGGDARKCLGRRASTASAMSSRITRGRRLGWRRPGGQSAPSPSWSALRGPLPLHPDLEQADRRRVRGAVARLEQLPGTLLHGDLHPDNTCAGGVIDLEGTGRGVLGYDAVTAVFVPAMCGVEPRGQRPALCRVLLGPAREVPEPPGRHLRGLRIRTRLGSSSSRCCCAAPSRCVRGGTATRPSGRSGPSS